MPESPARLGQTTHGLGCLASRLGKGPAVAVKIEDGYRWSPPPMLPDSTDDAIGDTQGLNTGSAIKECKGVQTDKSLLLTGITSLVKLRMLQYKSALSKEGFFESIFESKFKKLREENTSLRELAKELEEKIKKAEEDNVALASRISRACRQANVVPLTISVSSQPTCLVTPGSLGFKTSPDSSRDVARAPVRAAQVPSVTAAQITPNSAAQVALANGINSTPSSAVQAALVNSESVASVNSIQPTPASSCAGSTVTLSYYPLSAPYQLAPLPALYSMEQQSYIWHHPTPGQPLVMPGGVPGYNHNFGLVPADLGAIQSNTHVVHANEGLRMTSFSAGSQFALSQAPNSHFHHRPVVPCGPNLQHIGVPPMYSAEPWVSGGPPLPLPYPMLPRLKAKISASDSGIILTWDYESPGAGTTCNIEFYHLFANQARDSRLAVPAEMSAWKKIGVVNALPLPMACTLAQFATGNVYHFAVFAVDRYGNEGPLSNACTIRLNVSNQQ